MAQPGPNTSLIDANDGEICLACDNFKPWDEYDKDSNTDSGYRSVCRECRGLSEQSIKYSTAAEMATKLDEHSLRMIEAIGTPFDKDIDMLPHMQTIYQDLMTCFGGSMGLAQQVFSTYLNMRPGSQGRSRILQAVMRLGVQVSEDGSAVKRLENMTDEEFDEFRDKKMRVLNVEGKEVTDTTETKNIEMQDANTPATT
jgi:hypothetical protein